MTDSHSKTPLASLRGVSKRYGNLVALDGMDLAVHAGEVLALLGPNGAGKSTAISALLGLSAVDSGQVQLFGRPPQELAARRQIGVMLQSAGIPDAIKVGELLELTRSYYPNPRSNEECVALAGLEGLPGRRYGRLSGGQQRRVQFALAVCGNPQLVFLDEPTTGLDIEARQKLWEALRGLIGQGCAIVLTTHYLEEAEALADRALVLNRGRVLAAGSMAEIRNVVAQRRVRCVSSLDAQQVALWPQVRSAQRLQSRLEIVIEGAPESVVRRLLVEDHALAELEVQHGGLAEALVELTRNDDGKCASRQQEAA